MPVVCVGFTENLVRGQSQGSKQLLKAGKMVRKRAVHRNRVAGIKTPPSFYASYISEVYKGMKT